MKTWIKVSVIITYIAMIATNALANILPINGLTTGEVSDSFENLFAPAGLTFSIWGLIYLLLGLYSLYQAGLFRDNNRRVKLLNSVGIIFSISSIANAAWIFSWHYKVLSLSILLMLVILISLITIVKKINKEKLFISLPFSIYFGWIT
ncbi:MAG: tryptophan-rich sensory protein, partial [Senegalia sp. (in: firmicutes)]